MEFELREQEYIELNKLLKLLGMVQTGGEAKLLILGNEVKVNGIIENRIRKKLQGGDKVQLGNKTIFVR